MALMTMTDLLKDEVADILSAEQQIEQALPKMVAAAHHEDLRTAFQDHLEETHGHVQRLREAMRKLGVAENGKTCKAMAGILAEGSEMVEKQGDPAVKDAALIAAAQRVEHYEMAAYGCACTYADQLGLDGVQSLLGDTLKEEKSADEKLTKLATGGIFGSGINKEAKKS